MTFSIRTRRSRRKPAGAIEVDWNNAFAKDLRFIVTEIDGRMRELVMLGQAVTQSGSASIGTWTYTTSESRAAAISASGSGYYEVANNSRYNLISRMSLLWSGLISTGSAYRHFAGKHEVNGSFANPFDFRTDNSATPVPTLVRASDTGVNVSANASSGVSLGVPHQVGVSSNADHSVAEFYIDGLPAGSGGSPLPNVGANTFPLRVGQRLDGVVQMDGYTEFVAGWARYMAASEYAALREYPWQLVRPVVRRSYVIVPSVAPAGAGGPLVRGGLTKGALIRGGRLAA